MYDGGGRRLCLCLFILIVDVCCEVCVLVGLSGYHVAAVVDGAGQTPSFELRVALCVSQGVNLTAERGGGVQHAGARAE